MNPASNSPLPKVVSAIAARPSGGNALRALLTGLFSRNDSSSQPKETAPAPAEPMPPPPQITPTPTVLNLPKGVATEIRKALHPTNSMVVSKKVEPPAKSSGFPNSTIRVPRKMVHLPKDLLSALRKAPAPRASVTRPTPQKAGPKSLPPQTRFRGKDFPII